MSDPTPVTIDDMPAGEYAIVEALGHRTLVGRVAEVERFGTKMLQIEPLFVSAKTGAIMLGPVLLGSSSIYQFTPVPPAVALRSAPQRRYALPSSIEAVLPPEAVQSTLEHPDAFLLYEDEEEGRG